MSTQVLPALAGLGYPWTRSPKFKTRRPENISGKEVRIAYESYPRYTWSFTYDFLRQGTFNLSSLTEFTTLRGFFESRLGGYDSFLYTDPDDNIVTAQNIAVATAGQTACPLARTSGGFTIPVLAPNLGLTFNVYKNSVLKTITTDYTVTSWGASVPGVVTFTSPLSGGDVISVDMSYYFPVRFDDDSLDFEKFMSNLYSLKKMSFTSIK